MSPKIHTQEFKDAVIKYYERNHAIYQAPLKLEAVVKEYIHFFNEERPHRKLDIKTPLQFETESENI